VSKFKLGKGIDSLLPQNFDVEAVSGNVERIKNVFITEVHANPDQPRKEFAQDALEELASSIKQHGIIQPLIVLEAEQGYRIVAGERRYRAAKIAGLKKLPVIIRSHEELEELEVALIENVQRVDLSPLEQSESIQKLRDQFSMNLKDIARKLGKAEATISNSVRLMQLPEEAKNALRERKITEGHARAILALRTRPELQKQLLKKIMREGYSVRQAEAFVNLRSEKPSVAASKDTSNVKKMAREDIVNRLSVLQRKLGSTKITHKIQASGKGRLEIHFSSIKELDTILKRL
jgi:ParB family chromosome partitioning protein